MKKRSYCTHIVFLPFCRFGIHLLNPFYTNPSPPKHRMIVFVFLCVFYTRVCLDDASGLCLLFLEWSHAGDYALLEPSSDWSPHTGHMITGCACMQSFMAFIHSSLAFADLFTCHLRQQPLLNHTQISVRGVLVSVWAGLTTFDWSRFGCVVNRVGCCGK